LRQKSVFGGILLAAAALVAIPAAIVLGDEEPADAPVLAQAALGNAISYQGRLTESGGPADGFYDFRFTLYNAIVGGEQRGAIVTKDNLQVENGLFTAHLEFGADAFDGEGRWLEVAVRPGSQSGDAGFVVLSPRQLITANPYALWAKAAGSLDLPFAGAYDAGAPGSVLEITSSGDGAAITGRRDETAGVGDAIIGTNNGAGAGVRGTSNATAGEGVRGTATGEFGVGGSFTGTTALDVNGAIRVWGPVRPAFRVTVDVGTNTCSSDNAVVIDHPMANGDPDALLFVTALATGGATGDVVVGYNLGGDCPADKWGIVGVLDGQEYNVLVIKDDTSE
jgi:hypothetical protein